MTTAGNRVAKLLAKLDAAWTEFQESFAGLSDELLVQPGVGGEWSVRDTIAHVTWWDEEALKHLPLILAGGRAPRYSETYGGIDAFNARMTARQRDRSLADVRAQAEATHRRLVAYVQSLPPERIVAEPRFRRRLRLDTFGHYPLHAEQIRAWRQTHAPDD
ncbi:MAG TPA: DinB family protein [Thermomicrobiales bacterium]|jgi:hypothetical protein